MSDHQTTLKSFEELGATRPKTPSLVYVHFFQDNTHMERVFDFSQRGGRDAFVKFVSWTIKTRMEFTVHHSPKTN